MKKTLLSALAAAALLACGVAGAQNLAIVNGKPVPSERLDAVIQRMEHSGQKVTPEMQAQVKEKLIALEIFAQAAQAKGLDANATFKNQMELARQNMLANELFSEYEKANPVTDADIQAEYDKFVAANSGMEYHARHILVEKEDQAKSIIAQLKKGAKFDVLAKKFSKDPGSGANGGQLDWANPGNFVKEFSDAMVALKKGQTTEVPVKTQFGYHIIRLDDTRQAQFPKLEAVKPQIAQQLQQQKLAQYQEELRGKAKIE